MALIRIQFDRLAIRCGRIEGGYRERAGEKVQSQLDHLKLPDYLVKNHNR